ncbi:MAG: NAD(P)/FAD-dependent oxidoreductase [Gammaproteobacteria bacterium]|nr:NAD(P)/FAD-dependent oxidoreductase [Gammaproteobacteria bacterium]MBU1645547.1 NAD(P)/FAD-dependent oxidoreductase [Gammaproteobacteria bacterium]MBU1973651.1 NAD(P)/FAD-dependent oxidoreductase [Gammaproteobacteria bacterium]
MRRRGFLGFSAALGATLATRSASLIAATPNAGRVVIVGGGWGGLSAASHLRRLAPQLEVTLVERNAAFQSLPLSNQWLAGRVDDALINHDYARAARAWGYRFIRAEVRDIDRAKRRVASAEFSLDYDWLVLSPGIRYDWAAWFGDDSRAIEQARHNYPCAFVAGDELAALKKKLDAFAGGDLLMTIPPMPYRCPPAPYERALVIGQYLNARRIKGRLIVLDPNPMMAAFSRVFADQYAEQIAYVPHAAVKAVDPFARTISTSFDDYRFDDAILMAPQRAGELARRAGVVGDDGWARVDPLRFHVPGDDRVFVIGDAVGKVSVLFGHYPKSGHMAARQGRVVAGEIAARAAGRVPQVQLPDSTCHVLTRLDPPEAMRLDAGYRVRGDGEIAQAVQQSHDPNPRGEDVAWARGMFAELLAYPLQ